MPSPTIAIAVAVALAVASIAASARAQSDRVGTLRATARTAVAVANEHVDLRCEPGQDEHSLRCALTVTWTLRNESTEAAVAAIVFTWPFAEAPIVSANGVEADHVPTLRPLAVPVPPGGSAPVVLRATLSLRTGYLGTGTGIPVPIEPVDPLHARHPLLSTRWTVARRGIVWSRPDDLRFASVGPTRVTVHLPEGWQGIGDLRAADGEHAFAYETPEHDPPGRIGIELVRGSRGEVLRHGGPFLALGGTIDRGFRGRIGYEIGLGEWVLVSVALDTDLQQHVFFVPQLELASWGVVVVPSLAIGLGLPIQFVPTADVGLRLETCATLYALAFVGTFDYWPSHGNWHVSLLARVGL